MYGIVNNDNKITHKFDDLDAIELTSDYVPHSDSLRSMNTGYKYKRWGNFVNVDFELATPDGK